MASVVQDFIQEQTMNIVSVINDAELDDDRFNNNLAYTVGAEDMKKRIMEIFLFSAGLTMQEYYEIKMGALKDTIEMLNNDEK